MTTLFKKYAIDGNVIIRNSRIIICKQQKKILLTYLKLYECIGHGPKSKQMSWDYS